MYWQSSQKLASVRSSDGVSGGHSHAPWYMWSAVSVTFVMTASSPVYFSSIHMSAGLRSCVHSIGAYAS